MRISLALPVLERVNEYFQSEANFVQNSAALDLHDNSVDPRSPDACRFCTLGAIVHFSHVLHPRSHVRMEKADSSAKDLLRSVLKEADPYLTIVGGNDRRGWKFMRRMLKKTIDRYRKK